MPRMLDLFCGDGGSAVGYARAGFAVTGVDIDDHPRYPFTFHRADALTFPLDGFDIVTASPPCHDHSAIRTVTGRPHGTGWMLDAIRRRLIEWGGPYVIENVPGAPLHDPILLCGAAFNLTGVAADGTPLVLKRHRLFESNLDIAPRLECWCRQYKANGYKVAGVYGHGGQSKARGYKPTSQVARDLMGIHWMARDALSQAIPPAYTQWLGTQIFPTVAALATVNTQQKGASNE